MSILKRGAPLGLATLWMTALWIIAESASLAASPGDAVRATEASPSDAGDKSAPAQQEGGAKKLERAKHETAIYVSRMHCAGCAKKISRKLYAIKGVTRVQADVKSNMALVTPQAKQSLDPQTLWKAVASAGFKPQRLVGPQGTFEADAQGNPVVKTAEQSAADGTQAL